MAAEPEQPGLVNQTFGGELRSDVTCCACGYTSTAVDPFLDISLDIDPPLSFPPPALPIPRATPPSAHAASKPNGKGRGKGKGSSKGNGKGVAVGGRGRGRGGRSAPRQAFPQHFRIVCFCTAINLVEPCICWLEGCRLQGTHPACQDICIRMPSSHQMLHVRS